MKIGVFDSGLGGLIVLKGIHELLPCYDLLYLGDTKRLPYGRLSQEKIFGYTVEAMDYLFSQDCQLIVIACNTISTSALRRIQREYLPIKFPQRRVLGVVVPTVEAVCESLMTWAEHGEAPMIGVLGTQATVRSKAYLREFSKADPNLVVEQRTASRLVGLIEERSEALATKDVRRVVKPFLEKGVKAIVLGCTHYCLVKEALRSFIDPKIQVISQDEVVPPKLANYLIRHPEIEKLLTKTHQKDGGEEKSGRLDLRVTKLTLGYEQLAESWFGHSFTLREVGLN